MLEDIGDPAIGSEFGRDGFADPRLTSANRAPRLGAEISEDRKGARRGPKASAANESIPGRPGGDFKVVKL
jgi:hypothetical protein